MITFHSETNDRVKRAILTAKSTGARVRVWYGDTVTGEAWPEEYDVTGYVSNSMGPVKIPLLVHSKRSLGGGGMLDHCIVRIDTTDGQTLYRHPSFNTGDWCAMSATGYEGRAIEAHGHRYDVVVLRNNKLHARFTTEKKALNYIAFMRGDRYSK